MRADRAPRRLSKDARRAQLLALAMPVVAEQGLAEFSLEDIADGADVTRNLLYRYFPRGRRDIVIGVVERAGRELTGDWVTDETVPLEESLAANAARIRDHAFAPSDAWRIHRRARAADQPELNQIIAGYVERIIANISLNDLETQQPPPLVRLALSGYIAFAETILDQARASNAPHDTVIQILKDTLIAVIHSAREASSSTPADTANYKTVTA